MPDNFKRTPRAYFPDASIFDVLAESKRLKRESAQILERIADLEAVLEKILVGAAAKPTAKPKAHRQG